MNKILVILKEENGAETEWFLPSNTEGETSREVSILLIQKGNIPPGYPSKNILALDSSTNNLVNHQKIKRITYQDFLEKIFDADMAMVV